MAVFGWLMEAPLLRDELKSTIKVPGGPFVVTRLISKLLLSSVINLDSHLQFELYQLLVNFL